MNKDTPTPDAWEALHDFTHDMVVDNYTKPETIDILYKKWVRKHGNFRDSFEVQNDHLNTHLSVMVMYGRMFVKLKLGKTTLWEREYRNE